METFNDQNVNTWWYVMNSIETDPFKHKKSCSSIEYYHIASIIFSQSCIELKQWGRAFLSIEDEGVKTRMTLIHFKRYFYADFGALTFF